jgi:hypothetical protein
MRCVFASGQLSFAQIVSMQTSVGLKHVRVRVLRAFLKSVFLRWKDVCHTGVLDRLVGTYNIFTIAVCCHHGCPIDRADYIDSCADVFENAREDRNGNDRAAGSEGVRDSVPFKRNQPTEVVDLDSDLAIQVIKRAGTQLIFWTHSNVFCNQIRI